METRCYADGRFVALLGVVLGAIACPTSAFSQSVAGTITEAASGARVVGAAIILYDSERRLKGAVKTDSSGAYSIAAPAGFYLLSVQKSGLVTIDTEMFQLFPGSVVRRNFDVSVSPPRLATVTIEAKPIVNSGGPNRRKYDEFLRRRSLGMGTFLTREQIEAKPATQTYQLFQNIPGLKISQHGTQWFIRSQRCPATLPTAGPPPDMDEDHPQLFPIVFIDGFHVRGLGTLSRINPDEIEAIEVYQGAAQLPAEAKGNACAAIFVWLRQQR